MITEYKKKLDEVFGDNIFSHETQKNKGIVYTEFEDDFIKAAQKYKDELRDIYDKGQEEKVRVALRRIEDKILQDLKSKDKYKHMNEIPTYWSAKLRSNTGGYEDIRTIPTYLKGEK